MKNLFLILSAAALVAVASSSSGNTLGAVVDGWRGDKPDDPVSPVKIEVFYDSLCPYSHDFIFNQLLPVAKDLWKYINITMRPFANARPIHMENSTEIYYECLHGEEECRKNVEQSCLLGYVDSPVLEVELLPCAMETENINDCMYGSLPSSTGSQIIKCSQSEEGMDLYKGHADAASQKGVTYSPWILLNDKHTEELEGYSELNLKEYLCKVYLEGVSGCK